jgi:hypothetical protein
MSVWNLSYQFTSTIYLRNLARLQIWNQQNAYLATANAAKALVRVLVPKPIAIVSAAYALTATAKKQNRPLPPASRWLTRLFRLYCPPVLNRLAVD